MQNSMYVKKIVAQEYKHDMVDSSIEEFQNFINGRRPDFDDNNVLAVKFVFSIYPDTLDDAEETRWFINSFAVKAPAEFPFDEYGPKMASEFPPFLLKLAPRFKGFRTVFDEYERFKLFQTKYDLDVISVEEHANVFLQWVEKNPFTY